MPKSISCLMVIREGVFTLMFLKEFSVTWTILGIWSHMKSPWKPISWTLMSSSVVPAALKISVIEWKICTLVDFSSMTMKRISSVMDGNRCFSWLSYRPWKFSSIAIFQAAISSSKVPSASLIASAAVKFQLWRGGAVLVQLVLCHLWYHGIDPRLLEGWRHGACAPSKRSKVQVFSEEVVDVN